MTSAFRHNIKQMLPPPVLSVLKKILGKTIVEYEGDFPTWEAAVSAAGSYNDPSVFGKVKEARLKVLRGEAAYERDGVTFGTVRYFWPIIASILLAASKQGQNLNVLDFGGSLGTSYFQHKALFSHLKPRWNIVEQKHFVEFGRQQIKDTDLFFYTSVAECLNETTPNIFFTSSVLQYLPRPYELLAEAKRKGFKHLIFDRTTVLEDGDDRLVLQHVPRRIYATDFPAWLFNERKLIAFLEPEYRLVFEFPSIGDPITLDNGIARNKGFLFERVSSD